MDQVKYDRIKSESTCSQWRVQDLCFGERVIMSDFANISG